MPILQILTECKGLHFRDKLDWPGYMRQEEKGWSQMGPPEGGYIMSSVFQKGSFGRLRRKPCHCRYFTIILYLCFSVRVVVSTRLCHFVYVSVSRPLHLSESYSASQTLQYSPSCSSGDLHQGIAFVGRCDPKSQLLSTASQTRDHYYFFNLVGSSVMSLTNQFTLLSGQGAFFAAGLYIF